MSQSPQQFSFSIHGIDDINHDLLSKTSHVVSLVDPCTNLPSSLNSIAEKNCLVLKVHDALDSRDGKRAPSREDILALCHYADKIDRKHLSHLLIHCHMGRSRSTAAAAILLIRLCHISPREAFKRIRLVRDPVWPNWTMIEHGDDVLGCDGEMLRACKALYVDVRNLFPKWVEDPQPKNALERVNV